MASGASILLKGLCAPLSRVQSPCPRTSFLTSAASFLLGSCFFGPLTYSCIMWSTSARALAAAAKSHQSCPTLCDPIDGGPPGSPVPGILQARTLEWVAISFSNAWKWKVKGKLLSRVWLFVNPWTAAYQAPPSMGFPRQEYWSGLPLPSPSGTYYSIILRLDKKLIPFKWRCLISVQPNSIASGLYQFSVVIRGTEIPNTSSPLNWQMNLTQICPAHLIISTQLDLTSITQEQGGEIRGLEHLV